MISKFTEVVIRSKRFLGKEIREIILYEITDEMGHQRLFNHSPSDAEILEAFPVVAREISRNGSLSLEEKIDLALTRLETIDAEIKSQRETKTP